MKRILTIILASIGLIAAASAFAAPTGWTNGSFDADVDFLPGTPISGVTASRHNFGSFGSFATTNAQTGSSEVCVFCHTPHHTYPGSGGSGAAGPLWNRADVNSGTVYIGYGSTLGGSNPTGTGITINSISQACLSCHDGVTTFDSIVNAPGAGGVSPDGGSTGMYVSVDGIPMNTMPGSSYAITAADLLADPLARLNIGTNLANDHPISVLYNADRASLRPVTTIISGINLTKGLQASAVSAYGKNLKQNRWSIEGFVSDTATIQKLLKNGYVECTSCHDPHFKNTTWDEVDYKGGYSGLDPSEFDGLFLRRIGGNTGSGLCRTCHNK